MDAQAHKELLSALSARRNGENRRVELIARDLRGLYTPGADLVGARLSGARLQAASLAGARLARADLSGADLSGCDLAGADLTDANLQGANLTDALLDDTILTSADLRGACLTGVLGDPLSMAFARMDRATIERSEWDDQDVARFVSRGVDFHEPAQSIPPSLRPGLEKRAPSLVMSLRPLEVTARQQIAQQDEMEMPASLRAFRELSALIEDARKEGGISLLPPAFDQPLSLSGGGAPLAPLSLVPPAPVAAPAELDPFRLPEVGEEYLGVTIQRELPGGTVAKAFVGLNGEGKQVVVRVFDPNCPNAALQLPAFQRGVRALNRVQGSFEPDWAVVEVLAVAIDMTGYVARHYEDGCLEDLMGLTISLEGKLEIFEKIGRAVAALHREGLLLRCLKPRNILVDGFLPVIGEIDMVDLPSLRQSSRNLHGYGPFAAPEEVLGQGTRSPTADVFALGHLLRYMLGGAGSSAETLPKPLFTIVERATALEPANRYQYVEELLADVERFSAQGSATVFRASIRPAAVSRLAARPLTAPRPRREPSEGELQLKDAGARHWLPPHLEKGLAVAGLAVGVLLLAGVWFRPDLGLTLERYALVPAACIGLAAWFLPAWSERPALSRGAVWALATLLFFFVDFSYVSALRWHLDLRTGSVERKADALYQLARLGKREFRQMSLEGVTLHARDLGSINFHESSLRGSDLSGSFLMEANFTDADLTDVDLRAADLRGAALELATGLETVRCDRLTLLPADFRCRHGYVARSGS